ncbi:MAG: hypothetical protein ACXVPQ_04155 [Bacteroidia bacterium]
MKIKHLIYRTFFIAVVGLSAAGFTFCGGAGDKAADQGIIEYDTKVVDDNHPLAGLAPSSATLKFKKKKFIVEMSTMGMFNTMFICDLNSKTLTQMVKFMDVKQACIEGEKDILAENSTYSLKLEETTETKMIAGYKCYKVKVTMANDPSITFDAYYTKDMGDEHVNDLSPYKGIKGMLMQYRLKKMGLEMQFTAKSVSKADIPENTFDVPAYFKIVSKEDMKKFFDGLQ